VRVSIVIASHNEGQRLIRTIESCVETAGSLDYEIIVADDASQDGSADAAAAQFPLVRVVRNDLRLGASPTKAAGAREASGEIFIFLDGHTKPEPGALPALVDDVSLFGELAAVTPAIAVLDDREWINDLSRVGHGYRMDLLTFDCGFVNLDEMRPTKETRRRLYESPALIGCAVAMSAVLYRRLWGFDPDMRSWGVEDLDFSLKCWLLGYRILHDPEVIVGHRFQDNFDEYAVPGQHLVANQVRMARKHFTATVWASWVDEARQRHPGSLPEHPEGLWALAWQEFQQLRTSADRERAYLHSHRPRDEFWYAERFGLSWPQFLAGAPSRAAAFPAASPHPSPKPSPKPCSVTAVNPSKATVRTGMAQTFEAVGTGLSQVSWSAPGATPATGHGPSFTAKWSTTGKKTVTARCGVSTKTASVLVVAVPQLEVLDKAGAVTTSVTLGLWDHAFDSTTGALLNGVSESANFVGSDSRAFRFRVRDAAAHASVTIGWNTVFDSGGNDDAPANANLTLLETAPNSGVFVSRNVMLVSDDDDKTQATNSGLPAGNPDAGMRNPGQSNHRLRRVTVDATHPLASKVRATYTPALGSPVTRTTDVFRRSPDNRRRVRVHLVNVRVSPGGVGILTSVRRDLVMATFRSVYARAGIFAEVDEQLIDPPASCIGWAARFPGDPLANDPSVEGFGFSGTPAVLTPSATQNDLITAVRAVPGFVPGDISIVCVSRIYSTPLPPPGGNLGIAAGGQAFPDSFTAGTSLARGFAFVGVDTGITEFADPHEATHITTNLRNAAGGHFDLEAASAVAPGPIDAENLMNRFFLPNGNGVRNPKRLWDDTFTNTNRTPHMVIPKQVTAIRSSHFTKPY
jgi:GT2 family glycosyltransferase